MALTDSQKKLVIAVTAVVAVSGLACALCHCHKHMCRKDAKPKGKPAPAGKA